MNKQQLKTKLNEAESYLNGVSRSYNYSNVYCTNVKRYSDYIDIEDVITAGGYKPALATRVREYFTDDEINAIHDSWIEWESQYFIEDFIKSNCCEDKNVEKYAGYLDQSSIGFYGRSGGWLGVESNVQDHIDNILSDLEDGMTWDDMQANNDIDGTLATVEAIKWLLDEASKYNKGLKFMDELEFRVGEYVADIKQEMQAEKEVKQAVALAKKHGYIVSKAL